MIDIKLIRENPKIVKDNLKKRNDKEKLKMLDELIELDKKWRALIMKVDSLKNKRNKITKEIAELKKQKKDVKKKIREMKDIPKKIRKLDEQKDKIKEKCDKILMGLPNLLHETVPVGKDEHDNKEIRKVGKVPKFGFAPKNHLDLALNLDLIEQDQASKVAGHSFFYLKNELALLDHAILKFAIDFMIKKGYTLIEPPFMLRRKPYEGVTDLDDFENVMYKIENEDLYLIATSEHSMAAMYMNKVIDKKNLPIKLVGVSPCFRKEVGAHGKYTKGLFRMHQFNKVEQFIFCDPKDSWKLHEELQKNAEGLYKKLGLYYRVVNVCTGDIGIIASKKYDIEVWMIDNKFREAGSNSNCTDYQARRLNIKYREKEGQSPIGFVHTLNNTALATSRVMIAILEQCQQEDGSILIPNALRPYMNGMKKISGK